MHKTPDPPPVPVREGALLEQESANRADRSQPACKERDLPFMDRLPFMEFVGKQSRDTVTDDPRLRADLL